MHNFDSRLPRRTFIQSMGALSIPGTASLLWNFPAIAAPQSDRAAGMIVHTDVPRNAEPQLDQLVQSWVTPVESFYVRSHAPVPQISADDFRLSVEGMVDRPLSLSLAELRDRFTSVSAVATLTCAGNRRSEHSRTRPVKGVPWNEGAIGNARWGGVRLSDVLKAARVKENARHVWFEGRDQIGRGDATIPFGGSIPIEKAFADSESMPGALLASEMNDAPLTGHHGFPLRMVVPGYVGARSVKWLGRILVSDRPSPNHYLANAYKLVEENRAIEWAEASPIYRFPINAAICRPASGAKVNAGRITVRGYALPPGRCGSTIAGVELSTDRGRSWQPARLTSPSAAFTWQLWEADVNIRPNTEQLLARATDNRGRTQPQHVAWNMKGYLYNAWHQVPLEVMR